jgi:hypothetical protein
MASNFPIGFATHQMSRDKEFRSLVIAPIGYKIVEFDAAGQEFRWMAIKSRDPLMLALCVPGEDAHSFMGASIVHRDYHELVTAVHAGEKAAAEGRKMGKLANLCVAAGTTILTDRGPCSIEHVRRNDRVWDGFKFVYHDGIVCSGLKQVIAHDGVIATPTHEVLVDGFWWTLEKAAQYDWSIEPAMGTGWARQSRAAFRIMDGLVRRAIYEMLRAIRTRALRLWRGARRQFKVLRDWTITPVQSVFSSPAASPRGFFNHHLTSRLSPSKASRRLVSKVSKSSVSVMAQLRGAWDRMSLCLGARSRRVDQVELTTQDVHQARYRSDRQRWSLRAWKLALGYAQPEPQEPTTTYVYDIVNCGPSTRFAANGRIVHNSLQYRTSAKKLRVKARVEYNIPMQLPEAQHIRNVYLQKYRRVPMYWINQIMLTKQLGYVETLSGRRVQVRGDWTGPLGWSMESTAINYPIQGTGAEQKYLALAMLRPILAQYDAEFMIDLHDGLYFTVPEAKTMAFAERAKKILDNLPYRQAWGFDPPIPLPFDCKIGESWGTLHEVTLN